MRASALLLLLVACLGDPTKPTPDAPAVADAPVFSGADVFGDMTIEQGWDTHDCGTPEAASFKTGAAVAEIKSLWVYIADASNDDATRLDAAIYDSDGAGNPTTMLVSGFTEMVSALPRNQWYQLPLTTPYTPVANHVYWIAAMCPAGKGTSFTPVYKYLGASGAGACDATTTSCTQHGRSGEGTFDSTWQMTATYLPSTNSYYAGPQ